MRVSDTLPDATLVRRRLCPIRFVVCAAPEYLAQHGTPRDVRDLAAHNCLGTSTPPWNFVLAGDARVVLGEPVAGTRRVRVQGNLHIDSGDALRSVALLGHGIVCLPTFVVGEDLRQGRLVRILRERIEIEASAFAIYPQTRHPSPKVRALIDYLAESLGQSPEWDAFEDTAPRPRSSTPGVITTASS